MRRFTAASVCAYCAGRPGAVKTTPFGPEPYVYKSNGLMFALVGHLDEQEVVSLKCDPERSMTLRQSFDAICAACGTPTTVPFEPTQGREVFCRDCFRKMKEG